MRTTLDLNDQLARRAKRAAADSGTSLTALIEDALREKLERLGQRAKRRVTLPTFGADGTRPGVDLSRTAALLDLLDQEDS